MVDTNKDASGSEHPKPVKVDDRTVVCDRTTGRVIMVIDDILTLPMGAEIELTHPAMSVPVIAVSLVVEARDLSARIHLDMDVQGHDWEARDQDAATRRMVLM